MHRGLREPNCDKKAVTEEQKKAIQRQLEQMKPLVKKVFYESEQEAFDRFKKQFRNSPLAGNVRVGDIPQNFRVQLSDPTKYEVIVSRSRAHRGSAPSRTRRRSSTSSSPASTTSPSSPSSSRR